MKEYKSKEPGMKGKASIRSSKGSQKEDNDPMVEWALDLEYLSEGLVM